MPEMHGLRRSIEQRVLPEGLTTHDDLERNDTNYALENEHLLSPPAHALTNTTNPTIPPRRDTAFLDGLRGLCAVFVMNQHFIAGFSAFSPHEMGFGEQGHYSLATLPVLRVAFSGGDMAVVVFFVLSGYVLSIGPLHKIQQQQTRECRKGLLSAVIRRPVRLYVPPLVISLGVALLLHVPGPLMLPTGFHRPRDSVGEELKFFVKISITYFSLFHEHGAHLFSYPYNIVMWTLPIELEGSLLVYGVLLGLSMICSGPDPKRPTMVAVLIFGVSVVMLQNGWYWSMSNFLFGIGLAMLDTWSIGEYISTTLRRLDWMKTPRAISQDMSTIGEVLSDISSPIRRRSSIMASKLLPKTILQRLPTQGERHEAAQHTFYHTVCFVIGWYLLAQPSASGHRQHVTNTPGWKWLASLIPSAYDDGHYYRYWQSYGALLFIYALLRTPWLQRFFQSRTLRFFGYVSFMLYLTHLPWFRIFPDRFSSLLAGRDCEEVDRGGMWDVKWSGIPDWGPNAMSLRVWVYIAVTWPMNFGLAWFATKWVDQPSVRLGKWITTRIGLEKNKSGT
ncbi:O-acetyltransferase PaAT-1 [Fulvia fulva]|uniref:O-acetyltransferase PaAT-1 n=1 Tax=Passalora fulva TaxID=5499 RepID=A0A9Q8UUG8_PASFU|nr:O-acetyltransferase PaAT-1 [Fulvia fulva]KAK4626816.1 O-acetyltransferase PaAT-1 [Fulvia fulva]KAK4628502.1 O-acetyltransferase PaAT-1 [Fulvia fulva]UJO22782.1 O-acetyltransferase PaAT-1 [Fulvia fulva]WPV14038.1 O-acetyltransferase PaAT-1 [Fulvia fulva]WPV29347.1 O-acetyltransferase PaAT-1 [Fulvia fulva]